MCIERAVFVLFATDAICCELHACTCTAKLYLSTNVMSANVKLAQHAVTCSPWRMQVVKVAGVSLWALFREKKEKPRN